MLLKELFVQNFRNIDDLHLPLHPTLTILLGPNGSGKSNLLEAISLLSLPRSFRGQKDQQLIQWNKDFAKVQGKVIDEQRIETELAVFWEESKQLLVNGRPVKTTEFIGNFWTILFAPEEVGLLSGPPSGRRAFLDAFLSIVVPNYFYHTVMYQRVLTRRNKLLAERRASFAEYAYWNKEQVIHGSFVVRARKQLVEAMNIALPQLTRLFFYSQLVGQDEENSVIENIFQRKQASMFEREQAVGYSLVGPQRDDFRVFEIAGKERDLGIFGSRGEQRMAVILLKQAQLRLMAEQEGRKAVFLLDDVLSELDPPNQERLITSLGAQQTVLTTASLADVSPTLLNEAIIYEKVGDQWHQR